MLKKITLSVLWLVFPPLFLLLAFVWKMPRMVPRIILFVVAPLTLLVLLAGGLDLYIRYHQYVDRGSRSEIEMKSGVEFPRYRTIEKRKRVPLPARFRDFTIEYKVQLDTTCIRDFYQAIEASARQETDSLKPQRNTWSITPEGKYFFHDAGIDDPDQEFITVIINPSLHQADIEYGEW